jgi:non-heme chloroperoxidase
MRKISLQQRLSMLILFASGAPIFAQTAPPDTATHKILFIAVEPGVKLEVLDWGGTGRPLVLLAGLGNDAHVFDTFATKLSATYHVYGITRRGYGASDKPEPTVENYLSDRLGDDVIAVLDDLKLQKPVLAGHSIAGEELSSIGSRHPERVACLIYLDAGYPYALYDPLHPEYFIDLVELRRKLDTFSISRAASKAVVTELLESDLPRFEKDLRELQKELADKPEPSPVKDKQPKSKDFLTAEAIFSGTQRYTSIKGPVLAIFAEPHAFNSGSASQQEKAQAEAADTARVEPQAKAFEALGPNVRVVRLPHADHYVFRSNEADVMKEMNAFIATLPRN